MRTPKNILKHELIGLEAKVSSSPNDCQEGITGKLIDESRDTVVLESEDGDKKVPKEDRTFSFKLKDKNVEVEGSYLVGRPEDRIKNKVKKW